MAFGEGFSCSVVAGKARSVSSSASSYETMHAQSAEPSPPAELEMHHECSGIRESD